LSDQDTLTPVSRRRQIVFAISISLAGLAISSLCLVPSFYPLAHPRSMFPSVLQEQFFFDLFGWIGGAWLLSWVSALSGWRGVARIGQWTGIVILSLDQVVLLSLWQVMSGYLNFTSSSLWWLPALLQCFFVGYFLAFFTMPSLTLSGNRSLTGLGTLALLLPWLLGRQALILGTQFLCGANIQ